MAEPARGPGRLVGVYRGRSDPDPTGGPATRRFVPELAPEAPRHPNHTANAEHRHSLLTPWMMTGPRSADPATPRAGRHDSHDSHDSRHPPRRRPAPTPPAGTARSSPRRPPRVRGFR